MRVTKQGRLIDISLTVSPVRDPSGRIVGASKVGRDITDRKRAEEALRESDRRKDQFIALLAHELRNPLAPLRNGLNVMRLAGNDADAIVQARDTMDRQLGHMVRLVDDLLDISRISQNKIDLRRSRILLADVVSSAVESVRPIIDEAAHELIISLPADPIYLDVDLTRLSQVFSNLLTNSAKYSDHAGRIWLTANEHDGQAVVSVRDTGVGIPAEALPRIFDMFYQVDRSKERSTSGLGIGLALVKGLVELHGGTITATSAGPGTGSTFTVSLPTLSTLAYTQTADSLRPDQSVPVPPRRRILVVDDNRDSADSMAMMLKFVGNDVATAYGGIEALETAERFCPEVILMDVGMPRLNGYYATRRIRDQTSGAQPIIIALTGWGQERDRILSKEAGCDGHLVKPVELLDLEKALREIKSVQY